MSDSRPIGIFDSGVGGLTVVKEIRDRFPGEQVVYLGDTARVPYGSKSAQTVERYSLACLRALLIRDVKLVLVACNTASATALPAMTAASPVPVLGAVLPSAKQAVERSVTKHIGVLGTLATVRSNAYSTAIHALDASACVSAQACPLLVPLAEEGWITGEVPERVIAHYLQELVATDAMLDTLVLGCTHYPLFEHEIQRVARRVFARSMTLVSSAKALADDAGQHLLTNSNATSGDATLQILVTDATQLATIAERFLGQPIDRFEQIDLVV